MFKFKQSSLFSGGDVLNEIGSWLATFPNDWQSNSPANFSINFEFLNLKLFKGFSANGIFLNEI